MKQASLLLLCLSLLLPGTSHGNTNNTTAISGTVTVGSGGTYPTLTGTGGLFEVINLGGLNGNTTALIISDITEPGTIALNQWTETGGSNFTLVIQPDAAAGRMLSGSYAGGLIRLNGADRVTIDGRYSGSGKYLSVKNSNTSGTISAIQVISPGTGQGSVDITIRNCRISTGHNGSGSYGIAVGGSTSGTAGDDNDNLSVLDCNISKTHYGIYAAASASGVNNNLLVSGDSIGSSISSDYIGRYGIYLLQASGGVITGNTVYNLISSVLAASPTGMLVGAGVVNTSITRNRICGISYTGSSALGGVGMMVQPGSASSNLTIANNLIYDISGTGNNSPGGTSIAGIVLNGSSGTIGLYYNSVNLAGAISRAAATADKSMALYVNSSVTGLSMKNNNLVNSIENTSGTATAYAIYSGAANTAFTVINYNDYFSSGPEAMLGFLGANRATITAWRTATGQDAQSISSDPLYASATNLRCDYSSPVFLAGSPVTGITTDFDLVTRNATTPAIGAFETGTDARGPSYIYSPLGNTTFTTNRSLNVTMNDYTGIPSSGTGLPVLYWKINAGSWSTATAVYISPGQYQFTFGTGVVTNDVVSYYLVAQDIVAPPNVSASPQQGAAGFSADPPTCATPPSTPNSYRIVEAVNGTVTVGTSGTYPNLTGNSGLFKKINDNVVTGSITVEIVSDLPEDGTNALGQWVEEGGSGFSVTIRPDGLTERLISGNVAQGMIRLDGADRVTVDGRFSGSGRYLRFRNTNTANPTFHLLNDASGNTLRNCFIEGSALGTTKAVILLGTTVLTTGNDDNYILENVIRDRSDAPGVPNQMVYSVGTLGKTNSGNTVLGNEILNFVTYGVILGTGNGTGWSILGNHFYNTLSTPPSTAQFAIYINTGISPSSHIISGNFIGGQAPGCGGSPWVNTGTQTFCGIYVNATSDTPNSIQGNTIANISLTNSNAGSFNAIWAAEGKCSIGTVTGNVIGSVDPAATITNGTTLGASHLYGILVSSGEYLNDIENNTVRNLLLTGASGSPEVIGIYLNSANCRRNLITGLGCTEAAMDPVVYGIYAFGLPGSVNEISNNVISLDAGSSGNPEIAGYYDNSYAGCTYGFYYNSISISGAGTAWPTYAFYRGSAATYDLRDNVFSHSRGISGSNENWALYFSSPGFLTSGYNDIYCPNGHAGFYNQPQNVLVDWILATGQDSTSISRDPVFADPLLNLKPDMSSPLLWAGAPVAGITADFNGFARDGSFPSIGAFEYSEDFRGPVILFTPLQNTTSTATRTLTAIIYDGTGVPSSGSGLPVLYWKINNGAYSSSTAVFTGIDQYEFSLGAGVALGDQVSYYIVAQDILFPPYLTVSPVTGAGGFTADPPACSVPPSAPWSYKIGSAISGVIPVGTGQTCLNLTGNSGLFRMINDNVLTGDLTATITSDLTEEGIHALNNWAEEGTGPYTVTIKPAASATPLVTGSVTKGLIRFNGTDRVTIDGSNNGTSTRDLTFSNTTTDPDPYVIHFGSALDITFRDIVVKNCTIRGNDAASATHGAGLLFSGAGSHADTGYFDNISVLNNLFEKSWTAIYLTGGRTIANATGVTVSDNVITSEGSSAVRFMGIVMEGVAGGTVSGNLIGNLDPAGDTSDIGIWIGERCTGVDVHTNRIFHLGYSGTAGFGAEGIRITSLQYTAGINIYNNLIEEMTGDGYDYTNASAWKRNPVAITIALPQSGINVRFNTVNLYGNTLNQPGALSCGIFLANGSKADLQNNLIVNNLGLLGSAGYGSCAVMAEVSNPQFMITDHNNYYVSPSGTGSAAIGKVGTASAFTLGEWQGLTGQEANSLNENPLFVSAADLHPTQILLDDAGITIPGITIDYDGIVRGEPPDMGAYEFNLTGVKTWNGSVSSAWNDPDNWTPAGVPVSTDDVIIPSGTLNPCSVNATGLLCNGIVIYSGATVTVDLAGDLLVFGNLTIRNGALLDNLGMVKVRGNLENLNTD
jgi:hypothetical protein